jgi:hypothetical protein
MQICVSQDNDVTAVVNDFLSFNNIDFCKNTFWDNHHNQFCIPTHTSNTLLIIDSQIFFEWVGNAEHHNDLIHFCNRHNQLIVYGQYDHAYSYLYQKSAPWFCNRQNLEYINQNIKNHSIVLMLEAGLSDRVYLNNLKNIKIINFLNWHFATKARVTSPSLLKVNATHDYLLTMRKKKARIHRDVLWQELNSKPGLLDRGFASYKISKFENTDWVGNTTSQHDWFAGHASMDLYLDCFLEIVPETCYRDLYFFTEKTYKPIMTKTPFLVVSTAGYLKYLQNLGFKTFSSLISEEYDQQYRVEDRVKHMVNMLQDIIQNGTKSFYQASQDILEHNFSRLCEISGRWDYEFDSIMWKILNNFEQRYSKTS